MAKDINTVAANSLHGNMPTGGTKKSCRYNMATEMRQVDAHRKTTVRHLHPRMGRFRRINGSASTPIVGGGGGALSSRTTSGSAHLGLRLLTRSVSPMKSMV
jgi:hypothetical protein